MTISLSSCEKEGIGNGEERRPLETLFVAHDTVTLTPNLFLPADNLSWFREHLDILKTHAHSTKVKTSIYVTRAPSSENLGAGHATQEMRSVSSQSSDGGETSMPASPAGEAEKGPLHLPPSTHGGIDIDIEKEFEKVGGQHVEHKTSIPNNLAGNNNPVHGHVFKVGRPDVATLIQEAVARATNDQRVLVAACGPDGLMHVVRQTTAALIKGRGPAVELHCEQFGW